MLIEICANSFTSALSAQNGGADRIELCSNLEIGGMTPSAGLIAMIKHRLHIKTSVLIRPRSGDFIYSDYEIENILADIDFCRSQKIEGIVIGCLTREGHIDLPNLRKIIDRAQGLEITFHRAFDVCQDPNRALNDLIDHGVTRILTSGQKNSVVDGRELIRNLILKADGRIVIMPGGGINENNILQLSEITGAKEFHLSAKKNMKSEIMHFQRNVHFIHPESLSENDYWETDESKVMKVVNQAKKDVSI